MAAYIPNSLSSPLQSSEGPFNPIGDGLFNSNFEKNNENENSFQQEKEDSISLSNSDLLGNNFLEDLDQPSIPIKDNFEERTWAFCIDELNSKERILFHNIHMLSNQIEKKTLKIPVELALGNIFQILIYLPREKRETAWELIKDKFKNINVPREYAFLNLIKKAIIDNNLPVNALVATLQFCGLICSILKLDNDHSKKAVFDFVEEKEGACPVLHFYLAGPMLRFEFKPMEALEEIEKYFQAACHSSRLDLFIDELLFFFLPSLSEILFRQIKNAPINFFKIKEVLFSLTEMPYATAKLIGFYLFLYYQAAMPEETSKDIRLAQILFKLKKFWQDKGENFINILTRNVKKSIVELTKNSDNLKSEALYLFKQCVDFNNKPTDFFELGKTVFKNVPPYQLPTAIDILNELYKTNRLDPNLLLYYYNLLLKACQKQKNDELSYALDRLTKLGSALFSNSKILPISDPFLEKEIKSSTIWLVEKSLEKRYVSWAHQYLLAIGQSKIISLDSSLFAPIYLKVCTALLNDPAFKTFDVANFWIEAQNFGMWSENNLSEENVNFLIQLIEKMDQKDDLSVKLVSGFLLILEKNNVTKKSWGSLRSAQYKQLKEMASHNEEVSHAAKLLDAHQHDLDHSQEFQIRYLIIKTKIQNGEFREVNGFLLKLLECNTCANDREKFSMLLKDLLSELDQNRNTNKGTEIYEVLNFPKFIPFFSQNFENFAQFFVSFIRNSFEKKTLTNEFSKTLETYIYCFQKQKERLSTNTYKECAFIFEKYLKEGVILENLLKAIYSSIPHLLEKLHTLKLEEEAVSLVLTLINFSQTNKLAPAQPGSNAVDIKTIPPSVLLWCIEKCLESTQIKNILKGQKILNYSVEKSIFSISFEPQKQANIYRLMFQKIEKNLEKASDWVLKLRNLNLGSLGNISCISKIAQITNHLIQNNKLDKAEPLLEILIAEKEFNKNELAALCAELASKRYIFKEYNEWARLFLNYQEHISKLLSDPEIWSQYVAISEVVINHLIFSPDLTNFHLVTAIQLLKYFRIQKTLLLKQTLKKTLEIGHYETKQQIWEYLRSVGGLYDLIGDNENNSNEFLGNILSLVGELNHNDSLTILEKEKALIDFFSRSQVEKKDEIFSFFLKSCLNHIHQSSNKAMLLEKIFVLIKAVSPFIKISKSDNIALLESCSKIDNKKVLLLSVEMMGSRTLEKDYHNDPRFAAVFESLLSAVLRLKDNNNDLLSKTFKLCKTFRSHYISSLNFFNCSNQLLQLSTGDSSLSLQAFEESSKMFLNGLKRMDTISLKKASEGLQKNKKVVASLFDKLLQMGIPTVDIRLMKCLKSKIIDTIFSKEEKVGFFQNILIQFFRRIDRPESHESLNQIHIGLEFFKDFQPYFPKNMRLSTDCFIEILKANVNLLESHNMLSEYKEYFEIAKNLLFNTFESRSVHTVAKNQYEHFMLCIKYLIEVLNKSNNSTFIIYQDALQLIQKFVESRIIDFHDKLEIIEAFAWGFIPSDENEFQMHLNGLKNLSISTSKAKIEQNYKSCFKIALISGRKIQTLLSPENQYDSLTDVLEYLANIKMTNAGIKHALSIIESENDHILSHFSCKCLRLLKICEIVFPYFNDQKISLDFVNFISKMILIIINENSLWKDVKHFPIILKIIKKFSDVIFTNSMEEIKNQQKDYICLLSVYNNLFTLITYACGNFVFEADKESLLEIIEKCQKFYFSIPTSHRKMFFNNFSNLVRRSLEMDENGLPSTFKERRIYIFMHWIKDLANIQIDNLTEINFLNSSLSTVFKYIPGLYKEALFYMTEINNKILQDSIKKSKK